MKYALIEDNIVTNIISLSSTNAQDFFNAVPIEEIPVQIGDSYLNGLFYHNGEILMSEVEQLKLIIQELDETIINNTYDNIISTLM